MKYIIDKDGNITGKSFCEEIEGIDAPHKPLREDESCRWNGSEWEYKFREYPEKEVSYTPKKDRLYNSTKALIDDILTYIYMPTGTCIYGDKYKYKEGQKLTVLIPCYGKAKYIKDTVSSVLANTLLPDKIIILLMDNNSIALKDELLAMSSIIDCREHERLHVEEARNYLATLADSEWLMFLDADDQLYPDYFEVLLKGDEPNKVNAAIRHARMDIIDLKNGKNIDTKSDNPVFIKFGSRIAGTGSFICHSDIMKDYQFNPDCNSSGEDTAFFVDVACDTKYSLYCHNEPKFKYFLSTENSLSHNMFSNENWHRTVRLYIFPKLYKILKKMPNYMSDNQIDIILQDIIIDNNYDNSYKLMLGKCSAQPSIIATLNNCTYNIITGMFKKSRERKPIEAYSEDKFTAIGNIPEGLDLDGTEFDVLMFNDISETSPCDIFECQGNMLINNSILEEVMNLDKTWLERLIYLLGKYCVITLGNNPGVEDMFLANKNFFKVSDYIYKSLYDMLPDDLKNYTKYLNKPIISKHTQSPTRFVTFSLNRTCNKNCAYCNQLKAENIDENKLFENFDKYLTKAEEAYGDKLFPQLLGGEPTLLSYETQLKIINRLEKYPVIMLFTNGYDKKAPLYTHPNFVHNMHATTLKQLEEFINDKEIFRPVYVATKEQLPEIEQWLEEHKDTIKNKLQLIPCMNTGNINFDLGEEELTQLAQLVKKYSLNDWACSEMTSVILQQRFDIARTQCPKKTSIIQIDCITGKVFPCCNYSAGIEIDINEFDFSNPAKYYKAEVCDKCLTFSNYSR